MTPPATLFRYIAFRTVAAVGGLTAILASLVLLIDLIENMRFTGKVENAGFGDAVALSLLRLPSLTQLLFPFVFLFASIWMFHQLNKRSELSVMRAAGLSVWRLVGPPAIIAVIVGFALIVVIDPVSSNLYAQSEHVKSEKQGRSKNLIRVLRDGIWLQQRDETSHIIINARSHDRAAESLKNVTIWRFTPNRAFVERIDAPDAVFRDGTIELKDATITTATDRVQYRAPVFALPTNLKLQDLEERAQAPETISLWRLPHFIELAEVAGLPTVRYRIRFFSLCATPLNLLAMVLIAAAFSMRPMRLGGQFRLIIYSISAGFFLYMLSEISRSLGESQIIPAALAAWAPAAIASLIAISALLHIEDG